MGRLRVVDLEAQGVTFRDAGARVEVAGPRGRTDLLEAVRAEVAARVPLLVTLPTSGAGYGVCDACWDPLPHYRGGFCSLCCLARARAIKQGLVPLPVYQPKDNHAGYSNNTQADAPAGSQLQCL